MRMFGDRTEESLINEYMEDRPMMFGGEECDEIKETIRKLKDSGVDVNKMTVDELKEIHFDKDYKFK